MFLDERGTGLRVSWHPERDLVVLSVWQGDGCIGTFRMSVQDIPRLSGLLAAALGDWVDQTGVPPGSGGPGFLGDPGAGASRGSGEPRITGEWDVGVLGAGPGAGMGSATGAVPAGAGTQAVGAGLSCSSGSGSVARCSSCGGCRTGAVGVGEGSLSTTVPRPTAAGVAGTGLWVMGQQGRGS